MKSLENAADAGELFDRLFPLCRSILGEGYRQSLRILEEYVPFREISYESGRKVHNWVVPPEWEVRSGYAENLSTGERIADFHRCNLELMNYSAPFQGTVSRDELRKHLYTSVTDPSSVPYVFSYYKRRWGFAVTRQVYDTLPEGDYHVAIDTDFVPGRVVVGEAFLPSTTGSRREIMLTSYLCHPSMANNELSGPIVLAMLYQRISRWPRRRYRYRFLINPETIGSICYLSDHGEDLRQNLFAGMVLTCLGSSQALSWKTSRRGDTPFDQLINTNNLRHPGSFRIRPFDPSEGSDERQYCSCGYNLPVGQMARLVYGTYPEYHTSNDSRELMGLDNLLSSCDMLEGLLQQMEDEHFYVSPCPLGEVKLSDHHLYPDINSDGNRYAAALNDPQFVRTVMILLNYADGLHAASHVAARHGLDPELVQAAAAILKEKGLLREDPERTQEDC